MHLRPTAARVRLLSGSARAPVILELVCSCAALFVAEGTRTGSTHRCEDQDRKIFPSRLSSRVDDKGPITASFPESISEELDIRLGPSRCLALVCWRFVPSEIEGNDVLLSCT